jgi:hypothetical protein
MKSCFGNNATANFDCKTTTAYLTDYYLGVIVSENDNEIKYTATLLGQGGITQPPRVKTRYSLAASFYSDSVPHIMRRCRCRARWLPSSQNWKVAGSRQSLGCGPRKLSHTLTTIVYRSFIPYQHYFSDPKEEIAQRSEFCLAY